MAYFVHVKDFDDLKMQYRNLAKVNHPDAGGDAEVMKAINLEYDVLFPIWQNRYNAETGSADKETAKESRWHFYTSNGWAGDKYEPGRSTKEITAMVRAYVKEMYPTYKFSVRFSQASMCSEIHISLKEAPVQPYKTFDELSMDEICSVWRAASNNYWVKDRGVLDDAMMADLRSVYENRRFVKILNDQVAAAVKDIRREVLSYNYDDSDSRFDYFDTNFYFFGVGVDDIKFVPRTARIRRAAGSTAPATVDGGFDVEETVHTKTGKKIFVVRMKNRVSRDEYRRIADQMKALGGYYSRFVHGFVFKKDPRGDLKDVA